MAGIAGLRLLYPILRAFSLRMAKSAWHMLSTMRRRSGSFWSLLLGICVRKRPPRKQNNLPSLSPLLDIEPNSRRVDGTEVGPVEDARSPISQGRIPAYTMVERGGVIASSSTSFSLCPSSGHMNDAPYLSHDAMSASPRDISAISDTSLNAVIAEQSNSATIASRGHSLDVQEFKVASLANIRIKPVMPESTQRYDRRSTM